MDKSLSLPVQILLIGAGGLAVIAGPVLYLLPHDTATYFAWTIKHPMTPVYMGASYCAGIGNFWALLVDRWSLARVQLPAIIAFATTQLLATVLHVSIFNWAHPVAWAWLAIYIVSPIAAIVLFLLTERDYRPPTFAGSPLPRSLTPVMVALAAVAGLVGLALFLFPQRAASVWPWSLTPLTGRVIGGWYLASAALQWMLAQQRTLETAKVGLLANVVVTTLLLVGALVHSASFDGPPFAVVLYLLNTIMLGGFSVFSWLYAARRPSRVHP